MGNVRLSDDHAAVEHRDLRYIQRQLSFPAQSFVIVCNCRLEQIFTIETILSSNKHLFFITFHFISSIF